jgi:hypothetical protein
MPVQLLASTNRVGPACFVSTERATLRTGAFLRAYVITAGVVFGLIAFVLTTLASAALAVAAWRVARRP